MVEQDTRAVLITGCSSGFGYLIAKTLAMAGHHVFATMRGINGRNAEPAHDLTGWGRANNVELEVLELDVTSDESVNDAVVSATASAGRIDIVVNNAGASARGPIEAFSITEMQALFNLNVFGPMRVNKAVLPQMRERRSGLLIHVTSTLGRILPRSGGLYPSTKWALEGLAESLHYQLRPFAIDSVILEPGSFPTPATSKSPEASRQDIAAAYAAVAAPPRPREATAGYVAPDSQEVADAIKTLIDTPAGQRPLRTVVGPIFTEGVDEYNEFYERAKDRLWQSLQRPDQAITWGRR